MKLFQASTKSVERIQALISLSAIVGAWFVEWSWSGAAMAIAFFLLYSQVGIAMTYHRYWTHRSFTFRHWYFEYVCTLLGALCAKGSPLAWVYVHRLHHANTDTEKDPHSPHFGGFRFLGFSSINLTRLQPTVVRDLITRPSQRWMNDNYLLLIAGWSLFLLVLGPSVLYFLWVLPVAVVQFSQDLFNYFAHTKGYRNQPTNDKSTNCMFLWPLIFGEAWHNNHHAQPQLATTKRKWWELDPVYWLIRLVGKNVH